MLFGGLRHFFSLFSVNRNKRGTISTTNVCGYEKLMSESNTPSSSSARTCGRRQSSKPPRSNIRGKQAPEIRMSVKGACKMLAAPWPASIGPRDIATRPPPMKRSKPRTSTTVTLRKVRDSISGFKEATRNSELQLSDLFGGNRMLMQVTAAPVTRTSKKSSGKSTSPSPGVCRRPHLPLPAVASSSASFRQR
jgi:hypothetical protein